MINWYERTRPQRAIIRKGAITLLMLMAAVVGFYLFGLANGTADKSRVLQRENKLEQTQDALQADQERRAGGS